MEDRLVLEIVIFILAAVIGFELISRVPSLLHTPLMSATNAIHGIILVGALLVLGASESLITTVLGMIAVIFATINVVGGFVVTNRMLDMFKRKPQKQRRQVRKV
jgi:NAD(P) transhydrogenase subunit alpha